MSATAFDPDKSAWEEVEIYSTAFARSNTSIPRHVVNDGPGGANNATVTKVETSKTFSSSHATPTTRSVDFIKACASMSTLETTSPTVLCTHASPCGNYLLVTASPGKTWNPQSILLDLDSECRLFTFSKLAVVESSVSVTYNMYDDDQEMIDAAPTTFTNILLRIVCVDQNGIILSVDCTFDSEQGSSTLVIKPVSAQVYNLASADSQNVKYGSSASLSTSSAQLTRARVVLVKSDMLVLVWKLRLVSIHFDSQSMRVWDPYAVPSGNILRYILGGDSYKSSKANDKASSDQSKLYTSVICHAQDSDLVVSLQADSTLLVWTKGPKSPPLTVSKDETAASYWPSSFKWKSTPLLSAQLYDSGRVLGIALWVVTIEKASLYIIEGELSTNTWKIKVANTPSNAKNMTCMKWEASHASLECWWKDGPTAGLSKSNIVRVTYPAGQSFLVTGDYIAHNPFSWTPESTLLNSLASLPHYDWLDICREDIMTLLNEKLDNNVDVETQDKMYSNLGEGALDQFYMQLIFSSPAGQPSCSAIDRALRKFVGHSSYDQIVRNCEQDMELQVWESVNLHVDQQKRSKFQNREVSTGSIANQNQQNAQPFAIMTPPGRQNEARSDMRTNDSMLITYESLSTPFGASSARRTTVPDSTDVINVETRLENYENTWKEVVRLIWLEMNAEDQLIASCPNNLILRSSGLGLLKETTALPTDSRSLIDLLDQAAWYFVNTILTDSTSKSGSKGTKGSDVVPNMVHFCLSIFHDIANVDVLFENQIRVEDTPVFQVPDVSVWDAFTGNQHNALVAKLKATSPAELSKLLLQLPGRGKLHGSTDSNASSISTTNASVASSASQLMLHTLSRAQWLALGRCMVLRSLSTMILEPRVSEAALLSFLHTVSLSWSLSRPKLLLGSNDDSNSLHETGHSTQVATSALFSLMNNVLQDQPSASFHLVESLSNGYLQLLANLDPSTSVYFSSRFEVLLSGLNSASLLRILAPLVAYSDHSFSSKARDALGECILSSKSSYHSHKRQMLIDKSFELLPLDLSSTSSTLTHLEILMRHSDDSSQAELVSLLEIVSNYITKNQDYASALYKKAVRYCGSLAVRCHRWDQAYYAFALLDDSQQKVLYAKNLVRCTVERGDLNQLILLCSIKYASHAHDVDTLFSLQEEIYEIVCTVLANSAKNCSTRMLEDTFCGKAADSLAALYALHVCRANWRQAAQVYNLKYTRNLNMLKHGSSTQELRYLEPFEYVRRVTSDMWLASLACTFTLEKCIDKNAKFLTQNKTLDFFERATPDVGTDESSSMMTDKDTAVPSDGPSLLNQFTTLTDLTVLSVKCSILRLLAAQRDSVEGHDDVYGLIKKFFSDGSSVDNILKVCLDQSLVLHGLYLCSALHSQEKCGVKTSPVFALFIAKYLRLYIVPMAIDGKLNTESNYDGLVEIASALGSQNTPCLLCSWEDPCPYRGVGAHLLQVGLSCISSIDYSVTTDIAKYYIVYGSKPKPLPIWYESIITKTSASSDARYANITFLLAEYTKLGLLYDACRVVNGLLKLYKSIISMSGLPQKGDVFYVPYKRIDKLYALVSAHISKQQQQPNSMRELFVEFDAMQVNLKQWFRFLRTKEESRLSATATQQI